jgi:hypothetical protein
MKRTNRKNTRKDRPTLPELDQTKGSFLNSLTSPVPTIVSATSRMARAVLCVNESAWRGRCPCESDGSCAITAAWMRSFLLYASPAKPRPIRS